jgi:RimJ/RimL family protein N-acetyltransferase
MVLVTDHVAYPASLPEDVRQLMRDVFSDAPVYPADELARELAEIDRDIPAMCLITIRESDRPVAFLVYSSESGVARGYWGGVHPAWRSQGLMKHLLRETCAVLQPTHHRIWCDTDVANTRMQAILQQVGFRSFAFAPDFWHGKDYLFWTLNLRDFDAAS